MLTPTHQSPRPEASSTSTDITPSTITTLDTQHATHGSSYAYSSPDYPEFYDAWVEAMFAPNSSTPTIEKNEDIPIFTSLIHSQFETSRTTQSPSDMVNIVDLGTGTGRVVFELYRALFGSLDSAPSRDPDITQQGLDTSRIQIWGIDHSAAMLETAAKIFNETWPIKASSLPQAHWLRASASEFVTTLSNASEGARLTPGQIDVLIMSAGTIHHLVDPTELFAFLQELSRGLCPGSGRAAISVLDEMIPVHENNPVGEEAVVVGVQYGADLIVASKNKPGSVYVKSPTVTTEKVTNVVLETGSGPVEVRSQVRTDNWTVSFIDGLSEPTESKTAAQIVKEGEGKLVWNKEMKWSVAVWNEETFKRLAAIAQLEIIDVVNGGFQKWYVLKRVC